MHRQSRREFLRAAPGTLAVVPFAPAVLSASRMRIAGGPHPTPRAGISAAKVATDVQLAKHSDAIATFALARQIPEILDGVRCQCGCIDGKAYYSLLSCFETPDMMAAECQVCQAQARLAHRLHAAGKSLDEIRKGIDAKFG